MQEHLHLLTRLNAGGTGNEVLGDGIPAQTIAPAEYRERTQRLQGTAEAGQGLAA